MKPIIQAKGIWKSYEIGSQQQRYLSLRDSMSNLRKNLFQKRTEIFWALKDINFEIMPGECLGVIGGNGAGKSTLLKILSRITPPSKGMITMRGRVASLLEVGTGFHPELSGRENIYLNGSILGMKRYEINAEFDNIVDFSGIGQFLDTPLKHFSSGMQLRLAFSVAAHLKPEILLIDEVLAVGDSEFQKRCLGKMDEVSKSGRTVIFVSHDLGSVKSLCPKSILLSKGVANSKKDTALQIQTYRAQLDNENELALGKNSILKQISWVNAQEDELNNLIFCGDKVGLKIKLDIPSHIVVKNLNLGFPIYEYSGRFITLLNSTMSGYDINHRIDTIICWIEKMPIMYGKFYFHSRIIINHTIHENLSNVLTFNIMEGDFFNSGTNYAGGRSGININQSWEKK